LKRRKKTEKRKEKKEIKRKGINEMI
jgi:hypothetical protein